MSIPGACNGWAETQAAYRFFAQEDIDFADIHKPHQQQTQKRMAAHAVVLCIEDTTELNFNGQQIEGLGRLSYETQKGMYVHPTYAVTPDRIPLGVLNNWMWTRTEKLSTEEQKQKELAEGVAPKESQRWIKGYEQVAQLSKTMKTTRLVYVADREGDIMELLVKARDMGNPADWLIRSQHNRVLPQTEEEKEAEVEVKKLWTATEQEEAAGDICFSLRSRRQAKGKPARKTREVRQQLYVKRVNAHDGKGGVVPITCIVAKEIDPPTGEEAVTWRLVTNREVGTLAELLELIEWYRARWEIEILFDVLKNACRIEALQLSTIDRIECALALYLIVAWRIAHLMRMGEICPDIEAQLLFAPEEIQAVYLFSKKPLPKNPPKLNEVVQLIARLGGFLGRKSDGEPGVKTLWIGLQRLMDFTAGMLAARNDCV